MDDERVFGIDYETDEVVMIGGRRYAIGGWYDPMGNTTTKDNASFCMFCGRQKMWFAAFLGEYFWADVRH